MTILTVRQVIITLGNIQLDAYTSDEQRSDGGWVNYLSGTGLANSIGLDESTTRQKRLSKELIARLGEGFTTLQGKYKMSSGGVSSLNLWTTTDATKYWLYHYKQGNILAGDIIDALASTTLDIIINDHFERDYKRFQAEEWAKHRVITKESFWFMSDCIKAYYLRHPRVEKYAGQNYAEAFDTLNYRLFGKKAKEIKTELGIKNGDLNRDHFGKEALRRIDMIQRMAEAQVTFSDMSPCKAVNWAVLTMHYKTMRYRD